MTARPRGDPVRLRPGRPADAAAIARVMRAAIRGLPGPACTPRQREAWSSLPALYHRWAMGPGGERHVVAERRGRLVGYAAWRPTGAAGARRAEVTAVFVHPSAGGAGLGRRLVRAVEGRARRSGARTAEVIAARPAIRFYAALGYALRRTASAPLPGGARLPAAVMRRSIATPDLRRPRSTHRRASPG